MRKRKAKRSKGIKSTKARTETSAIYRHTEKKGDSNTGRKKITKVGNKENVNTQRTLILKTRKHETENKERGWNKQNLK